MKRFVTGLLALFAVFQTSLAAPKFPNPATAVMVELVSGNQSVTAATATKVLFATVTVDTASGWSASNHNYVVQSQGLYSVCASAAISADVATVASNTIIVSKNGLFGGAGTPLFSATLGLAVGTGSTASPNACAVAQLAAGDTVEVDAYISGTNTTVLAQSTHTTYLSLVRVDN